MENSLNLNSLYFDLLFYNDSLHLFGIQNQNLLIFHSCSTILSQVKICVCSHPSANNRVYRNVCEKSVAIIFQPNKNIVFNNSLIELFALSWYADYNELLDLGVLSKIFVKSENVTVQNNDWLEWTIVLLISEKKYERKLNLFKLNVTRSNQYVAGNLNVTVDNFRWACIIIYHYKTDNNWHKGERRLKKKVHKCSG